MLPDDDRPTAIVGSDRHQVVVATCHDRVMTASRTPSKRTPAISAAPSSRSGMGAWPYTGGVTFRVWAPNATGGERDRHLRRLGCHAAPTGARGRRHLVGGRAGRQGRRRVSIPGPQRRPRDVAHRSPGPASDQLGRQRHRVRPGRRSTGATRTSSSRTGTTSSSMSSTWAPSARACTVSPAPSMACGRRLPYLRELGIGAIQLMPPFEFAGDRSWGYNPAFPYAVETTYGGPGRAEAAGQGRPRAGHRGHPRRGLQPPRPVRPGPVAVRRLVGGRQGRHLLLPGRALIHALGRDSPGLRPRGRARVPARQRAPVAGRVPGRRPALGCHGLHLEHHRRWPHGGRMSSRMAGTSWPPSRARWPSVTPVGCSSPRTSRTMPR